jgi:hypothetical protein
MKRPNIFFCYLIALLFFVLEALPMAAQPLLYPVRVNDKWGYVNRAGNMQIKPEYNHVQAFSRQNFAIVQKGKKVGVIDTTGRELLPFDYEIVDTFNTVDNIFIVRYEGDWQLRDINNKRIINKISGEVKMLEYQYLLVSNEFGFGLMHIDSNLVIVQGDSIYLDFKPINADYVLIKGLQMQQGLANRTRGVILPPVYQEVNFSGDMIFAKKDFKWGVFDTLGQPLSDITWDGFTRLMPNIVLAHYAEEVQVYNTAQKKVIYKNIDKAYISDNYIVVVQGELEGLIDTTGRLILPAKYDLIYTWNGFLAAKKQGKMGLYSLQGEQILAHEYENIIPFDNMQSLRMKDEKSKKWGIFDMKSNRISCTPKFESIDTLDYNVALARSGDSICVIDSIGNISLTLLQTDSLFEVALASNSFSYRTKKGGKKIVQFDADGKVTSSTEYVKYEKIRVRTGNTNLQPNNNTRTAPAAVASRQINERCYWTFHTKQNKWGVRDSIDHKWVVPPTYTNILEYRSFGFTLVFRNMLDLEIQLDKVTFKYITVMGIFNNEHNRLVTKMEFIGINIADFTSGKGVARCVFSNGMHGLVAKSGKIVARDYLFAGNISEGKVRVAVSGTLSAHIAPNKNFMPIMPTSQYLRMITVPTNDVAGYSGGNYMQEFARGAQIHCEGCKWGLIDTNGTVLLKPQYEFIEDYHKGAATFKHQGKWGLLDANINPVLKAEFTNFSFLPNSNKDLYFITKNQSRAGCIDSMGRLIVPMQYDRIRPASEGMIGVCQNSRWGFVSIDKRDTVVGCQFNNIRDFKEGFGAVLAGGRWGFINKNGSFIIKPDYSQCGDFSEGKAWVRLKAGKMGYIDASGNVVFEGDFRKLTDFINGMAVAADKNYDWGIIDEKGNWLLKPSKQFDKIEILPQANLAIASIGDKKALINTSGKILSPKCAIIRPFSEGLAAVRKNNLSDNPLKETDWGFIDTLGNLVGNFKYHQLGDFHDGRARAYDGGGSNKWGYIDRNGVFVIEPVYQTIRDFKDGRAIVFLGYNRSGLIDTAGKYLMQPNQKNIIDNERKICLVRNTYSNFHFISEDLKRLSASSFTQAHPFSFGVAPVKQNDFWGLLNEQGLMTLSPKYQLMEPFSEGYARVGISTLFGVANAKGEILIEPNYEYIHYMGNNVFRVENGDTVEYLDTNGKFLWREKGSR